MTPVSTPATRRVYTTDRPLVINHLATAAFLVLSGWRMLKVGNDGRHATYYFSPAASKDLDAFDRAINQVRIERDHAVSPSIPTDRGVPHAPRRPQQ